MAQPRVDGRAGCAQGTILLPRRETPRCASVSEAIVKPPPPRPPAFFGTSSSRALPISGTERKIVPGASCDLKYQSMCPPSSRMLTRSTSSLNASTAASLAPQVSKVASMLSSFASTSTPRDAISSPRNDVDVDVVVRRVRFAGSLASCASDSV